LKVERFGLRDKQTHWNASNRPYVSRLWPRPEGVESAQLGNHASKTIATGLGIRERGHCENDMDGAVAQAQSLAEIRLPSGDIVRADLHWYEAAGIGRHEMKIKAFI
jgi:hypothetical protein